MAKNQFHQDYYIPSEQNGSTEDNPKRRTKYRTIIIIVLVSSCFVALAAALTVVFVFSKPKNEKQGMENTKQNWSRAKSVVQCNLYDDNFLFLFFFFNHDNLIFYLLFSMFLLNIVIEWTSTAWLVHNNMHMAQVMHFQPKSCVTLIRIP